MLYSTCAIWMWRLAILFIFVSKSSGSEAEEAGLLVATEDAIFLVDFNTSEYERIADNLDMATAIDYDLRRGLIIFSERSRNPSKIYSMDMTGADKKIIFQNDRFTPDGLSVDWIYGNVYWTDDVKDTISVASLDGRLRKVLFNTDLVRPRAIVVNPLEGWMFWSDWGARPKIERSGMDGTHRSTIISQGIDYPNGLSIDIGTRKIYWIDGGMDELMCADYDGSNVKAIISSSRMIVNSFGLDIFEDSVYWSDRYLESIYKADKFYGRNQQIVASGFRSTPLDIRVLHSSKQPKGTNYCRESGVCSYWCLPAPLLSEDLLHDQKKFTCVCPDGIGLMDNQENCSIATLHPATETVFYETEIVDYQTESSHVTTYTDVYEALSNETFRRKEEDSEDTGGAGIVIGILLALAILISAVGFYIYKQWQRRNITTEQENPVYQKQTEYCCSRNQLRRASS